jgi:tRNA(Ile)-lysidine synthase TilS/MesJ
MSKDTAFFLSEDAMLNYTSNSKMNFIQSSYQKFTMNAIKTFTWKNKENCCSKVIKPLLNVWPPSWSIERCQFRWQNTLWEEKLCNGTKFLIRYRRFYITSRYVINDIFWYEIYRQFPVTIEWLLYIHIYVITRYVIKEFIVKGQVLFKGEIITKMQ